MAPCEALRCDGRIVRLSKSWDGGFFAAARPAEGSTGPRTVLGHDAVLRAIHTSRPDLILPG
jgi:hypothetical protein